jgi:hypothetical protein
MANERHMIADVLKVKPEPKKPKKVKTIETPKPTR